ncbi:MAG: DUF559 domain-containing protein [Polyangiaceae bacterium]|nr:DUF559 domain-containing protein [Polyangiaceae bacterium]
MVSRRTSPHCSELLAQRAGRMRFAVTSSEQLLWLELRGKRLGVSFRRQVPLGGRFIVDFLACGPRLVVEVDGGYHVRRVVADARRDRALVRLGYRVLRLDAELVVRDMAAAVELVRAALAEAG